MFLKLKRKIFLTILVFLSISLFAGTAHAETISGTFSTLANFINKNIVTPIKNDFCRQYALSLTGGLWKEDEFRTKVGKKVCTSYNISESTFTALSKDVLETIDKTVKITPKESPSTSSVSANNPKPDIFLPDTDVNSKDLSVKQIIYYTNLDRKSVDTNLVNLKENSILNKIATARVKDMFAKEYFEHDSPTGDNASKQAVANGYVYITIGENIALGNFDGSRGVVTSWMNSPGHRANILNKNYTEIGVSAIKDVYKGQVVWIAAQIFGKPITGCVAPSNTLKDKIEKSKVAADNLLKSIQNIDNELKTMSQLNNEAYNAKVVERNSFAKIYNDLATEIKELVAEYNKQTATYNACIKTV